ncbi:MAG TPA: hypothetical protein VF043_39915 [Ktedonobacteraceae bacterium]
MTLKELLDGEERRPGAARAVGADSSRPPPIDRPSWDDRIHVLNPIIATLSPGQVIGVGPLSPTVTRLLFAWPALYAKHQSMQLRTDFRVSLGHLWYTQKRRQPPHPPLY